MIRILGTILFLVSLCTLQSGCCCCQLPFGVRGGGPQIAVNPPQGNPPQGNPPPVNPPQGNPPPVKLPVNPPPVNPPQGNPPPVKLPPANDKPVTVRYQYYVNTGQFKSDGKVIAGGFSGKGEAKNDPASYKEKIVGVIPQGEYRVERRRIDARASRSST